MTTATPTALADQLATLNLHYTASHLDALIALATKQRWSVTQLLAHVVHHEQEERARRGLERRLTRSRLGRFKPLADFDGSWPKRIDRDAVEAACGSTSSPRLATSCSSPTRTSARR